VIEMVEAVGAPRQDRRQPGRPEWGALVGI